MVTFGFCWATLGVACGLNFDRFEISTFWVLSNHWPLTAETMINSFLWSLSGDLETSWNAANTEIENLARPLIELESTFFTSFKDISERGSHLFLFSLVMVLTLLVMRLPSLSPEINAIILQEL